MGKDDTVAVAVAISESRSFLLLAWAEIWSLAVFLPVYSRFASDRARPYTVANVPFILAEAHFQRDYLHRSGRFIHFHLAGQRPQKRGGGCFYLKIS